jgi:hypothetical protein
MRQIAGGYVKKLIFLVVVAVPGVSHACSVCIAHALGAAFRGLGAQTAEKGITIAGVSYTVTSQSQAGEEEGTVETHYHREIDFDFTHSLTKNWTLRANIPLVHNRIDGPDEFQATNGLGDISVGGLYQFPVHENDKAVFAASLDVKFPTGENSARDADGTLFEEHAQPGTGTTDLLLGGFATWDIGAGNVAFAGVGGRFNGKNSRGQRFGPVFYYSVGRSFAIGRTSEVVVEWNGRIAGKDRTPDGTDDPNSGGHVGYLSLSYRQEIKGNLGLIVAYQLPLIQGLNGSQTAGGLFSIGLSVKF